jgi:glycosyltransferase involved in cell wall biosynthesis
MNGAIVRSHYFVKYLSENNKIWFVYRAGSEKTHFSTQVQQIPNSSSKYLQILHFPTLIKLICLIKKNGVNIIFASHFWSGLLGVILRLFTGKYLIFDNHNVEYLRFKRNNHIFWWIVKVLEAILCRGSNKIICVSEMDKLILQREYKIPDRKLQVLPNGADISNIIITKFDKEKIRRNLNIRKEEYCLLFFGDFSYPPNREAVKTIIFQLLPILNKHKVIYRIIIAGRCSKEYQESLTNSFPYILFLGFVENIMELISSADCVIVPLLSGSGSRLKIIESIACGTPVVSTSMGAEGLEIQYLKGILRIENNWEDFCNEIIDILLNPTPSKINTQFLENHDWQKIVNRLNME